MHWNKDIDLPFQVCVEIYANYSEDFVAVLTKKISEINTKLISFNSKIVPNNKILVSVTLKMKSLEHLRFVLESLKRVDGVLNVKRM